MTERNDCMYGITMPVIPENQPPHWADRADFPEVFINSYWGCFIAEHCEDDILDNRDTLGKELDVRLYPRHETLRKNHHPRTSSNDRCYHDHPEYYRIQGSSHRVILFSPYSVPPEKHEVLISEGWTKIKPMYGNDAVTYMKIVSSIGADATIMDVPECLKHQ